MLKTTNDSVACVKYRKENFIQDHGDRYRDHCLYVSSLLKYSMKSGNVQLRSGGRISELEITEGKLEGSG